MNKNVRFDNDPSTDIRFGKAERPFDANGDDGLFDRDMLDINESDIDNTGSRALPTLRYNFKERQKQRLHNCLIGICMGLKFILIIILFVNLMIVSTHLESCKVRLLEPSGLPLVETPLIAPPPPPISSIVAVRPPVAGRVPRPIIIFSPK